jgi:predicted Zn-dependent peptidase
VSIQIPHRRYRLANGLQVILHRDVRLPRVVVNLLYRVGSRDDPPGRTGIAHLFEHLMFMGTRRVPEGRFDLLMEQLGGHNNAFTSEDVTDYYDVAPARGLELLLDVEADRMATLARALTRKKLELQREVVLNERRQHYENAPYGELWLSLPSLLYPTGHPYSWPVIGASEDLRAVTVDDARQLFLRFYSPRNACLVVAGSFDEAHARALIERRFARIPAAAPPPKRALPAARLARPQRRVFQDRVELPKLVLAWHSPASYARGDAELDLAASILALGKQSRLHRRLVHEQELAVEVSAHQESRRLGSQFLIEVTARPTVDLAQLERELERTLGRFLARPPRHAEVERARNGFESDFVARLEPVARRAELLNLYFATTGVPDYTEADLARYRAASPTAIWRWCRRTLGTRRVSAWVVPGERPRAAGAD